MIEKALLDSVYQPHAKISQGSKYTSRVWKCSVIGLHIKKLLVSADVRGGGTCDEALRMFAWEATLTIS